MPIWWGYERMRMTNMYDIWVCLIMVPIPPKILFNRECAMINLLHKLRDLRGLFEPWWFLHPNLVFLWPFWLSILFWWCWLIFFWSAWRTEKVEDKKAKSYQELSPEMRFRQAITRWFLVLAPSNETHILIHSPNSPPKCPSKFHHVLKMVMYITLPSGNFTWPWKTAHLWIHIYIIIYNYIYNYIYI